MTPEPDLYMDGCQNHGPLLGTLDISFRILNWDPKRDQDFDNHPYVSDFAGPVMASPTGRGPLVIGWVIS